MSKHSLLSMNIMIPRIKELTFVTLNSIKIKKKKKLVKRNPLSNTMDLYIVFYPIN